MKTAMQKLISALTNNGLIIINQTLIDTYLEKEKEQIKRAYNDCHSLGHIYGFDAEEYFIDTYQNK